MSEAAHGGAFAQGPHWSVRFWRKLGFYGRWDEAAYDWRQDVPPGGDLINTDVDIRFSFGDRVRILLTGHVAVSVYVRTAEPCNTRGSMSDVRVMP